MLSDKLKRWLVANRAWEIYTLLQRLPEPESDLITSLDEQIDLATVSDVLRLNIYWPSSNKKLAVREIYTFSQSQLDINSYSYSLIEIGEQAIIRADSLPHHQRDYRDKLLTNFPHHLHDEKGRICSFSGNLEDFIKRIARYYR